MKYAEAERLPLFFWSIRGANREQTSEAFVSGEEKRRSGYGVFGLSRKRNGASSFGQS